MDKETTDSLRLLRSGIYLFAILAMFAPMVLLAMSGAFGGVSHELYIDVVLFLCVLATVLLAVGFAALVSGRRVPGWLVNAGPIAACLLAGSLPFGPYRENVGFFAVISPVLLLSITAFLMGFVAPHPCLQNDCS